MDKPSGTKRILTQFEPYVYDAVRSPYYKDIYDSEEAFIEFILERLIKSVSKLLKQRHPSLELESVEYVAQVQPNYNNADQLKHAYLVVLGLVNRSGDVISYDNFVNSPQELHVTDWTYEEES